MKPLYYFHPIYLRFLSATLIPITLVFVGLFTFSTFSYVTLSFFYFLSILFSLTTSFVFARQMMNLSKGLSQFILSVSPNSPIREEDFLDSKFSFRTFKDYFQTLQTSLQVEQEQLEALLVTTQDALFLIDRLGHLRFVNAPFWQIFNLPEKAPDQYRGKPFWEFFRDANLNERIDFFWQNPEIKLADDLEVVIQGKIFLISKFYLPSQQTLLLSLSNVTELRGLEAKKRDLVANVSHELNTPLTSMIGYLETLVDKEKDPLKLKYLEIIFRNTKRLAYIVKDLLQLSRLERGADQLNFEKIEFISFIKTLSPFYEDLCHKKNLCFETVFSDEAIHIKADRYQIEQVLINLIENAIRYTDQGGIKLTQTKKGEYLTIGVSDTGIGIPQESQERIFERFFVVDQARSKKNGGTGLGLAIVKHIIKLHGGKIDVKSQLGQGTTFFISLKIDENPKKSSV